MRAAVVTGAGRGIGAGIADALADTGRTVVRIDLRFGRQLRNTDVVVDVRNQEAVGATFERIASEFGPIDCLVNAAGIFAHHQPLLETPADVIERVLGVNLIGTINCCRGALTSMRSAGGGRIVNIASQTARSTHPGLGIYSASKAAVVSITQTLALELARFRIMVNAVCPGTHWTPDGMTDQYYRREADEHNVPVRNLLQVRITAIPLGRLGTAGDVARAVVWLCSNDASFTTGAMVNVTGGETLTC